MHPFLTLLLIPAVFFTFLNGCGKPPETACGPGVVDAELEPYVTKFNEEASIRGVQLPYVLGNASLVESVLTSQDFERFSKGGHSPSETSVTGRCDGQTHDLLIQRSFFDSATETQREELIFHELGHCTLGRDHFEPGTSKALIPMGDQFFYNVKGDDSLMVSTLSSPTAYETYRKEYLDALFENRKVDFTRGMATCQPKLLQLLTEKKVALEALINQVAVQAEVTRPVKVTFRDWGCDLKETVFSISPEDILYTDGAARLYLSQLALAELSDETKRKALDQKVEKICKENEKDPLCPVFKP